MDHYPRNSRWPPAAEAVAAAANGDQRQLGLILGDGVPKLVAFFRGMGFNKFDAEDLASDTCEALVRHLPRLRNHQAFEAWFWRIARNKYHDHLRRRQRKPTPPSTDIEHDQPEDELMLMADHAAVRVAFDRVSPRDRELLWLRDVVEMSYADIAASMRNREGAVRVAVMRARQRLEVAIQEVEAEDSYGETGHR